jgi:aspartate/methionine/tyrosine aminotransferase
MILSGPDTVLFEARRRLEIIADTYLSVSTPVQVAAAALLEHGAAVRKQIQERLVVNLRALERRVAMTPSCRALPSEGGWYAVLQVPSFASEEELVLTLLQDDDVLVHPGFFFDFATESFLILSLLTPLQSFDEAVGRILRRFSERVAGR